MYVKLVDLGILEDPLNRIQGTAEEVLAEFLEAITGNGCVEVNLLEQGVDLDGRFVNRR